MDEKIAEIWAQALYQLEMALTKQSFSTWFKGTMPVGFNGDTLTVRFPNEFSRDWVEARYLDLLKDTISDIVGDNWDVRLVVDGDDFDDDFSTSPRTENKHEPDNKSEVITGILNPKYTFDTFVVGNSNRFAHAAALAVAEAPARAYNPLFLYGGVGLGKTHLMQAIGHYVLEQHKNKKVVYVSSERFTNDLIVAIEKKSMAEFRTRYRNADILIIDDIQFVAGKERTQEEIFHTFNSLHEANKQIIISSDRPPREIPTLEERLRSRFEWGLTTDLQAPDLETRIAILRQKARSDKLSVPNDVLAHIADQVQSNIRELEGALNRVIAYAGLHNQKLSVELAAAALRDILSPNSGKKLTIDSIQAVVSDHYGVAIKELKSKKRTKAIAYPRQIAMFLSRELTDSSLPKIGEEFGGRDHTTVLHAYDKISEEKSKSPEVEALLRSLSERIKRG